METRGRIGSCASSSLSRGSSCDGFVFSSSKLVLKLTSYQGKKVNLNTGVQVIQDTDILEAGLVEVVVGSKEEIGWVMGFSRGDYYLKAKYVPRLTLESPMRKIYLAIKFK